MYDFTHEATGVLLCLSVRAQFFGVFYFVSTSAVLIWYAWYCGNAIIFVVSCWSITACDQAFINFILNKLVYFDRNPLLSPSFCFTQFGWAAVQISHLAMMNDLTVEPGERTLLMSLRHLFTVLSNLSVYLSTYFLLSHDRPAPVVTPNATVVLSSIHSVGRMVIAGHPHSGRMCVSPNSAVEDVDFGPKDLPAFRNLSLAIIGVGALMTVLFHLGLRGSRNISDVAPEPTETSKLTSAIFQSTFTCSFVCHSLACVKCSCLTQTGVSHNGSLVSS